jgi:glycine cleavage system H protein
VSGDLNAEMFEFAMGQHLAKFPCDRVYVTNHMWGMPVGDGILRFGLTAYAVRLLQDVYFLDWLIEPGTPIDLRGHIGSIESKKAESDLYAPIAGVFHAINEQVLDDPSMINADTYGDGWLIQIQAGPGQAETLLSPDGYAEHLVTAWDVAQKTIKGQANF